MDDELHDYWTQLTDQSGAMLFGRNTYELMEGAWPAVARDEKAPRAMREWAQKLEAKAKYVVSATHPWRRSYKTMKTPKPTHPSTVFSLADIVTGRLPD